jgi:hypothetical protein
VEPIRFLADLCELTAAPSVRGVERRMLRV